MMNMRKLLLIVILLTIILSGCGNAYRKITAEEAYKMQAAGAGAIFLDVRTSEEFSEKRINGAVLIPDYEIKTRVESEIPDKKALIFIYCRSGNRSAKAAHIMIDIGYSNVYDLGGIIDWSYDTVSDRKD